MKKIFTFLFLIIFFGIIPLISIRATTRGDMYKDNCEDSAQGASYNVSTGDCTCPSGYYCYGTGCLSGSGNKTCKTGEVSSGDSGSAGGAGGNGNTGGNGGAGGSGGIGGTGGSGGSVTIENPLGSEKFEDIIDGIVNFVFYVAVALAPLMVIYGGYKILSAGDTGTKVEEGRKIIFYALLGLFIVLFAKGIVSVLKGAMGVTSS